MRRVLAEIAELRPAGSAMNARVSAGPIARDWRPGQFVLARSAPAGRWDPLLRRPHWVTRGPADDLWLWGLADGAHLGQAVDLLGPLGRGFALAPTSRSLLLVGEASGLAPLLALADEASARELSVTLLAGFPAGAAALAPAWVAPAVEYVVATPDGGRGHVGSPGELVGEYVGWADEVVLAGSDELRRATARALAGTRKPVQVALDGWVGCGTGLCSACLVRTVQGPRRVCRDGPVFSLFDLS